MRYLQTLLFSLVLIPLAFGQAPAVKVCDRSKPVCVALEKKLKKKCAEITAADLASITELVLPHIHIKSFKDDDFAGLTKLKKLEFASLLHNQGRPKDPIAINGKVFAHLPNLEQLIMDEELGLLPDDVFAGLTSLKVLDISGSTLSRLPKSLLTLPRIEAVHYGGDGMSKEDFATLKKVLGAKLKNTQ